MPSTTDQAQQSQSHPRRPALVARQSSISSQVSQSPSDASSLHRQGHYKPQRHVVGHGRLGPSGRNSSIGKNLNKLTKITPANDANSTSKHHTRTKSGEGLEPSSNSPRPSYTKRNASAFVIPKNTSHSALKKNYSSGQLPRHGSSKNIMKTARHQPPTAKRTRSNRSDHSEQSEPDPAHPTVHFALGDEIEVEPGEEHDGDEWTEESASASPHTTRSSTPARRSSIISDGPMTAKAEDAPGAHDTSSEAESSGSVIHASSSPSTRPVIDRSVTARQVNGSSSYQSSRPPDADAITSRLLQRAQRPNAAPQVSTVSAVVTSDSHGVKSLSHSQGSTLQEGTPDRDLVSRFIHTSSSGGTPKDVNLLPAKQQRSRERVEIDNHKRNQSTPNFTDQGSSPTSSYTRTLSHRSGTTTPTELPPSRTQQKLFLQRASSNIEPQKYIPAVLPRSGASQIIGHGVSFTSNEGTIPAQIQGLFSQATKEYQVVRRFRNPVSDAVLRLGDIPGTSRHNTHIPKQKGKAGYVNGGDGKFGLSQSYRSREERQNERESKEARHGHGPGGVDRGGERSGTGHGPGHRTRVSFDLPRPLDGEDEEEGLSVGSDDGRIIRDEAYEVCRRLWEIGEVAEGG